MSVSVLESTLDELIALVLGLAPERLPTGATMKPAFADAIVADPARLLAAAQYWQGALNQDTAATPDAVQSAQKLMTALPDTPLATLFLSRAYLTDDPGDEAGMIGKASSMLADAEIASFLGCQGAAGLRADLAALLAQATAAAPAGDAATLARGLRAAREIHDAYRRITLAGTMASAYGHSRAEALALHRQEGAFCLTPLQGSFSAGPLIHTAPGTPRDSEVAVRDPQGKNIQRPGFSLVYTNRNAQATPGELQAAVALLGTVWLGGLDALTNPALEPFDELLQGIDSITPPLPPPAFRPRKPRFMDALTMAQIEVVNATPDLITLNDNSAQIATHLLAGCESEMVGNDNHLVTSDGQDAVVGLLLQNLWYASRRDPVTLLAWRDRAAARAGNYWKNMSPFLSYMRYHVGDPAFVGFLMRVVANLAEINRWWSRNSRTWGTAFPTALGDPSKCARAASAIQAAKLFWTSNAVPTRASWINVGLLDEVRKVNSTVSAALPYPSPPKTGHDIVRMADQAKVLMDTIAQLDLMPAIEAALQYTPISNLVTAGLVPIQGTDKRVQMRNCHSFERLRLGLQNAITAAGI